MTARSEVAGAAPATDSRTGVGSGAGTGAGSSRRCAPAGARSELAGSELAGIGGTAASGGGMAGMVLDGSRWSSCDASADRMSRGLPSALRSASSTSMASSRSVDSAGIDGRIRATRRSTSARVHGCSTEISTRGRGRRGTRSSNAGPAEPAATTEYSTRDPSASPISVSSVSTGISWRSSMSRTGRVLRCEWVRSRRDSAAAASWIAPGRVVARIRAAICSRSGTSSDGTSTVENPLGGACQKERKSVVLPWPQGPRTRTVPAPPSSTSSSALREWSNPRVSIQCSGRGRSAIQAAISASKRRSSWFTVSASSLGRVMELIAQTLRKNSARRTAILLLAACGLLAACAHQPDIGPTHHRVRAGETLESIAAGYGVSPLRLARANGLETADRLEPGQRLRLPTGARIVHRVRRGETLDDIARRYQVRASTISHLNRLGRFPELRVGQRLALPDGAKLPAPTNLASAPAPAARTVPPRPSDEVLEPQPDVAAARPTDGNLERARTLVDRAMEDYRSARFERALKRANEAETLVARSDDRDARSLGARAVFVTGSSLAALGETSRAKDAFARVHALDPQFEPPDGWLSPRLEA